MTRWNGQWASCAAWTFSLVRFCRSRNSTPKLVENFRGFSKRTMSTDQINRRASIRLDVSLNY